MNKKWIIAGLVVLVVLVIAVLFMSGSRRKNGTGPILPDAQFEHWGFGKDGSADGFDMFDEEGVLSYDQLIEQAKLGKISLVSELWRMRRNCPKEMDFNECNEKLRAFISKKFPYPDNEKLLALFDKYIKYESTMMQTKVPENLTNQQRYAFIKQKRRELFGEEDAHLIFGYEESKADFAYAYGDFLKSTAGQPGEARLAAYEQMRKKAYGNYYDAMIAAEPKYDKFQVELQLRDGDFTRAAPDQRNTMTQALREKYFGADGASRMAEVDRQLAQDEEKEKQLAAAESKFLSENSSLPQDKKDAKIMELRKQYLGDEDAEAYTRRMEYEKFLKSQPQAQR